MSSSLIASTLLTTTSSGTDDASMSWRTTCTASIWPSGSGSEPSTTCSSRSAAATSSRVERKASTSRSEEHTSELQSRQYLVCRLLLVNKQPLPPFYTIPRCPTAETCSGKQSSSEEYLS